MHNDSKASSGLVSPKHMPTTVKLHDLKSALQTAGQRLLFGRPQISRRPSSTCLGRMGGVFLFKVRGKTRSLWFPFDKKKMKKKKKRKGWRKKKEESKEEQKTEKKRREKTKEKGTTKKKRKGDLPSPNRKLCWAWLEREEAGVRLNPHNGKLILEPRRWCSNLKDVCSAGKNKK